MSAYEEGWAVYLFHLKDEEKTGESILVKTPEGQTILIDAGVPEVGPQVDAYLDELHIDRIDYVMPSHPHYDHIGGLQTVFKTKEIGKVIETNVPHNTVPYVKYKNIIKEKNINVNIGESGDVSELEKDITLEIINPPKDFNKESLLKNYSDKRTSIINNASMVIKLTFKNQSFLFTGDIYAKKEIELVSEYSDNLQSNVLVAPHHGNITSSSKQFIKTVNPDITIIPSNHMFSKRIYNRYGNLGSDVYHSIYHGNDVIISDGEEIGVVTEFGFQNWGGKWNLIITRIEIWIVGYTQVLEDIKWKRHFSTVFFLCHSYECFFMGIIILFKRGKHH